MSERSWSWSDSMEEAVQKSGGATELMRDLGVAPFTDLPDQFTHWIEEQRSWAESVAFADQSFHMTDLRIEGPDALEFYKRFAVNSFEGFDQRGKAKQMVVANPNGYFIGDAILFSLGDDEYLSVGAKNAHNWLLYQAETGDWDVETEFQRRPVAMDGDPNNYRYQVQGPDAIDTMREAVDGDLPDINFFNFEEVEIAGHEVNLLRHGMAGEAGFEFWGPWEDHEEVRSAILEAGDDYGIRRLGSESYQTANAILGWLPLVVPAIFDDEMEDYREWLDVGKGLLSIGGSFDSEDITDYYVTPVEVGYDHIINFDHDFVGKEALQEEIDDPERKKVTLEWDAEDLEDAFGSLFTDGDSAQYMDLPHPRSAACPYDEVHVDGEHVGVSTDKSYVYNVREFLSLALLDTEYAEPGTEVTVVWGDPNADCPAVERHEQVEISATVAPAPYGQDKR